MKYAVLTPTFRRPQQLLRCVKSVQGQSEDYVHIIINDSPDTDYHDSESVITNDPHILYLKNEKNIGKNASLNRALEHLRSIDFKGYIVFLDDDDWFSPSCLADFGAICVRQNPPWVVSERALADGTALTKNSTGSMTVDYLRDYLLLRRFSGDATHCIRSDIALACSFPTTIPNAEEWIFFSEVHKRAPSFVFIQKTGTLTEGYATNGLNTSVRRSPFSVVSNELSSRHLWSVTMVLYMLGREIKRWL